MSSLSILEVRTMSSREIAEVTEKGHRHVCRDIRKMLMDIGIEAEGYAQDWTDPQNGVTYREFLLPKDLTLNLIAGYRADLRLKIIRRWMELEGEAAQPAPTPAVPKTFREALLLAADQQEQIERQQAQIEQDAPKVAALAMISEKDGDLGIRDTGRELGIGQTRVRAIILARRWACVQGRDIRPAHYGLEHGYVRMVARIYTDRVTGQEKVTDDFKITRKGITRLAEIIAAEKAN